MEMKPCFIVHNLNKGKHVYRAVKGALAQTIPCHVLLTDAQSTDNSWEEMNRAVKECPMGAKHEVTILQSPMKGENSFQSCSDHFQWVMTQTQSEWLIPSTSDDYSLPDRARVCMEAAYQHDCASVATTMYFEKDGETNRQIVSGFPRESGYVPAGIGIRRLAFGSCIAAYRKSFLEKVGGFGPVTPDVAWGYLAALDRGYYVVANPQHVHVQHEDVNNLGFEGKMKGAKDNPEELARLNELNHFQLFQLFYLTAVKANELYPLAHQEDKNAIFQCMMDQAVAWYGKRDALHKARITPGIL